MGKYLHNTGERFGTEQVQPKWVLASPFSARVKNYKQVLILLEGCFYFGTHALLAVVDKFVIYTLPPPREVFLFV